MDELKLRVNRLDAFGRTIQSKLLGIAHARSSSMGTTRGVVELLARRVDLDPSKVTDGMITQAFDELEWPVKDQISR